MKSITISRAVFCALTLGCSVPAAMSQVPAHSSMECAGVQASHSYFRSISWEMFYDVPRGGVELVVYNKSDKTVFFQYWDNHGRTDWSHIGPGSPLTIFMRGLDSDLTKVACNLSHGVNLPRQAQYYDPPAPRQYVDHDSATAATPGNGGDDDLGGVSVDPAARLSGSALAPGLGGDVLKLR